MCSLLRRAVPNDGLEFDERRLIGLLLSLNNGIINAIKIAVRNAKQFSHEC